ncbi:MAG TPA: hypothetical protein VFT16_06000 [Candidatus Saccharimonadales bacterium]|nr:hypothetical protein [Candidatus Saccharimonadales bacterium]
MSKFITKTRMTALTLLMALLTTGFVLSATPAQAASTTCRTLNLNQGVSLGFAVQPHMRVPVCYNGSKIWVNGGITPGVTTIGYSAGGFDWYGQYHDSRQNWLGVGENFSVTLWTGGATLYCTPRWLLNANGAVYSYKRGC